MAKLARKLTELVGNTPLLQLTDYSKEKRIESNLIAKLEYFKGQSFFSWDWHHVILRLLTPPLTVCKSNVARLIPTAKNSRTSKFYPSDQEV